MYHCQSKTGLTSEGCVLKYPSHILQKPIMRYSDTPQWSFSNSFWLRSSVQSLLQPTNAPLPEYKTAALKKSRFVLSHYGLFKSCWDWLILIATFYVAIVVPYNASFVNVDKPSMVSDVIVEALFIVGKYYTRFLLYSSGRTRQNSFLYEVSFSK